MDIPKAQIGDVVIILKTVESDKVKPYQTRIAESFYDKKWFYKIPLSCSIYTDEDIVVLTGRPQVVNNTFCHCDLIAKNTPCVQKKDNSLPSGGGGGFPPCNGGNSSGLTPAFKPEIKSEDEIMKDDLIFEKGYIQGRDEAKAMVKKECELAFDHGYSKGYKQGKLDLQNAIYSECEENKKPDSTIADFKEHKYVDIWDLIRRVSRLEQAILKDNIKY